MVRQASESGLCVGTLGALLGRFHVRAADETDKALNGSFARKTLMRKQACTIPKKGMDASSRVNGFIELTKYCRGQILHSIGRMKIVVLHHEHIHQ